MSPPGQFALIFVLLSLEQGKTFPDAKGDVLRTSFCLRFSRLADFDECTGGLQVVEAACGIPNMLMGQKLEVSKDMDTETRLAPLGVGAAICPFNL